MSRAIRRQQASNPQADTALKRPLGPRGPRQTRGARPPAPPRKGFRPRVPGWIDDIISELKKVTWPTREETAYLTMVVLIVAVSVGIVLGSIDIFFNWFIDRILLR